MLFTYKLTTSSPEANTLTFESLVKFINPGPNLITFSAWIGNWILSPCSS